MAKYGDPEKRDPVHLIKCNITICKNHQAGIFTEGFCSKNKIELSGDIELGTLECLTFKHKDD